MSDFDDLDDFEGFIANLNEYQAKQVEPNPDEELTDILSRGITRRPIIEPTPEPVPYVYHELTKTLCTCDTETDPFRFGREPMPFWVGFYDGSIFLDFWGEDAVDQFFEYLVERRGLNPDEELVIYAHNGGKFDFNLYMDFLDDDSSPFLINSRIVKVSFAGIEFRDSYAIMPIAQGKFAGAKLKISYDLFEREVREQHKAVIREYARHDVVKLWELVDRFISRFGWRLTVAGTALPYLESFHGFNKMTKQQDADIRPYYAGGRVQCFEVGIIRGRFKMVDRNSMYPSAMKFHRHPVGAMYKRSKEITDETDFAYIEAYNRGALGIGNGLNYDFTVKRGKFFATAHEIRAGLDTGTLDIIRVISAWTCSHHAFLDAFVDHFYGLRTEAGERGDKVDKELYKLILNSAYGKTAMNTAGYKDWLVNPAGIPRPLWADRNIYEEEGTKEDGTIKYRITHSTDGWKLTHSRDGVDIWSKPTRNAGERFLNVGLAASITGASRADLWRSICDSKRILYCDTDSLICEETNVPLNDSKLGAWKVEAEGDAVLIAGKKMYAFLSLSKPSDEAEAVRIGEETFYVLKKAHKGVTLTGQQIADICGGAIVEHENMAPSYDLTGKVKFTKRRVKMTATGDVSPQLEMDL